MIYINYRINFKTLNYLSVLIFQKYGKFFMKNKILFCKMSQPETYSFNVAFIGNANVGKTCIINRAVSGTFDESLMPTVLSQVQSLSLQHDGAEVQLRLYDTAGQEKYRSLSKTYIRNKDLYLLIFAIDDRSSFDAIKEWVNDVNDLVDTSKANLILVGNKSDLTPDENFISDEEAEKKASELKIPYYKISAKNGENMSDLFKDAVDICLAAKEDRGNKGVDISKVSGQNKGVDKNDCCNIF